MDTSHSTVSLPQQPLIISSNVDTQNDDVTSDTRTPEVEMPQPQPVTVPAELPSLDTRQPQPVAVSSQLTSAVDSDVGVHVDDVSCDVRTDYEHIHDDEHDIGLDETLYHDCISASFAG